MPKETPKPKKTKLKKKATPKKTVSNKKISKTKKARILTIPVIALVTYSVVISVGFVILLWRVNTHSVSASKYVSVPTLPVASKSAPVLQNIGLPMRIKIPSINVDAVIEKVGLKNDGSMGVPKDPMNTGWYEFGPRPGEVGSAVIDGHVDWWYGAPAVFPNLKKVKVGDKITVQDEFGTIISFVVRKIQSYGATDNATNVFISNDNKSHLNLITCTGVWDSRANQYSQRLVVFADKE